jgi:hypothetical protein
MIVSSTDQYHLAIASGPVHFLDRFGPAASGPIIGTLLEVRLKEAPAGGGLNQRSMSGRSPPPGFGIITRRLAQAHQPPLHAGRRNLGKADPVALARASA